MQRRRRVHAADRADVDHRRHRAAKRHEGAEIAEAADAHAEEFAVLIQRQRRVDDIIAGVVIAALALDQDGKFLGVRIRSFGNLGAFVSFRGAMPPVVNIGTVCGVYTTPALHVAISGMLTNTHCTSPYRGAGRPEASYMIERLIDIAADEMK